MIKNSGNSLPKVSCLTVTRGRVKQLKIVIDCFYQQTYGGEMELIIVYEDDDNDMKAFVNNWVAKAEEAKEGEVKFFCVSVKPVKRSLGWLRNYSVSVATGIFVTQWDDDDWYHKDRVKLMSEHLLRSGKLAIFLNRWLILDKIEHKAYVGAPRIWEGSIFTYKTVVMKLGGYGMKSKGEDTCLIKKLEKIGGTAICGNSSMYVYVIHGNNTWERQHFKQFLDKSWKLSDEWGVLLMRLVNGDIDCNEGCELMQKIVSSV